MSRIDLCILAILLEQKADSFMIAMSIDEIAEAGIEDVARITLYKHLKELVRNGYIGTGAKAERAGSYYITDKGMDILNLKGSNNHDKK